VTAPANAAVLMFQIGATNTAGTGYIGYVCIRKKTSAGSLLIDGSVTATQIAANTITASKIMAGTLTATELATDSVTTSKIAAGAVVAEKLTIGNFTNLVPNHSFELGNVEWSSLASGVSIVSDATNASSGSYVMKRVSTANDILVSARNGNMFECRAGDKFYLKGLIKSTSDATGTAEWRISWRDKDKAEVGTSALSWTPGTSYVIKDAIFTAPTGTSFAVIETVSRNQTAGTWYWGEVYLSNAVNTTNIVDGAISTDKVAANAITAAKIAAGTITANEIAAGTITSAKIATDTITSANIAAGAIGASEIAANAITAAKIAAGTITANEIASGAITSAEIASGAVTAVKLAADSVTSASILAGAITTTELADLIFQLI
jgi:hypothetical protein